MSADQICGAQRFFIHDRPAFELGQFGQIHNGITFMKSRVVESALRQSPNQRHLAPFESETEASARSRFLPLVALAAGFAVPRTFAAAEALHSMSCSRTRPQIMQTQPSRLFFFGLGFHDGCPPSPGVFVRGRIPRTFKISSRRRKFRNASMVALTSLALLLEPSDFARTSRIPAASTSARTPPPAITRVPGDAGRNSTRPPPNSPIVS